MLHTLFHGNRLGLLVSGEVDFKGFLPFLGVAAILVM